MNKNGVPMQWQITPYFIHFELTLVIENLKEEWIYD